MPYLNRIDKQMVPLGRNLVLAAHNLSKFDEMLFQMGKSEVCKNRVFSEAGKFRKNAAQENYKSENATFNLKGFAWQSAGSASMV